jgi:hypothetical protein
MGVVWKGAPSASQSLGISPLGEIGRQAPSASRGLGVSPLGEIGGGEIAVFWLVFLGLPGDWGAGAVEVGAGFCR